MRATCLVGHQLVTGDLPEPRPGGGELLIRVQAVGITTTELGWYPTLHTKEGAPRTNAVPAHEFSGRIQGVGDGVNDDQVGAEVFGMNDWFADGALAEFCIAPSNSVTMRPLGLDPLCAAAIPIAGLTAWQGLYIRAGLRAGDRVLIHGGAGAVGTFAIQLAKLRGAYVITTASASNRSLVAEIGADEVIDYRTTPFESVAKDLDIVFDAIGGETLARSWGLVKSDGRLVTIASSAESSSEKRVRDAFFIVEPNQRQLDELAAMVISGSIRAVIDAIVPWSRVADVYEGKFPRQSRGKIVVDCNAI